MAGASGSVAVGLGGLSGSNNTQPSLVGAQGFTDPQINANTHAGYTWDPVKLAWVPKAASVNSTNALYDSVTGGLSGSLSGSGTGGAFSGSGATSGGSTAQIGPIAMQDTSAADAAGLAIAKDKVGKSSAASLRGLREAMGSRGMLGSGQEGAQTEAIAEAGQGEMADTIRQQTKDNSDRTQRTAELNYQGGIQQRGQDIQAATTRAQQNQTVLLGLLQALGPMSGTGGVKY